MGSFSWLKADTLTDIANIPYGMPFKCLIPKEFGGGYIEDCYQDYGRLGTGENGQPLYDMYELLAFWNADMLMRTYHNRRDETPVEFVEYDWLVKDELQYEGEFCPMKKRDEFTDANRCIGINIGCYDNEIDQLKYPLKLVSVEYEGAYEDCPGRSYADPEQGFWALSRNELKRRKG